MSPIDETWRATPRTGSRALSGRTSLVAILALWCLVVWAVVWLVPPPTPMNAYRPCGLWHYLAVGAAPIGAWQAARYGGAGALYLIYGALCGLGLSLRLAQNLPVPLATEAHLFNRGVLILLLPVALALACRFAAALRRRIMPFPSESAKP